jgi:S-adenosylmethionine hydrolase
MPLALARTYADLPPGGLAVLASSQGYLELAVNLGSAAGTLGLSPGDTVRLASAGPAPGGPDGAGA